MIIVRCTNCQTQYRVDSARIGGARKRLKCARCGTVFPIEQRQQGAPAPDAGPHPAPAPATPHVARLDVAVVGIEAGARRLAATTALSRLGVRCITADDGPTALDVARRSRPRLIVADMVLPGLTGPELAEFAREDVHLCAARIVLVGPCPSGGKYRAPVTAIHDVDAHVEDPADERFEACVRGLLHADEIASAVSPDPPALELSARLALSDLLAYEAAEIDRALHSGRLSGELVLQIAESRHWCRRAHPGLREEAGRTFDSALENAFAERSAQLGLPPAPPPS